MEPDKWTYNANYLRNNEKEHLGEWIDQEKDYCIYDENVGKDMGKKRKIEPNQGDLDWVKNLMNKKKC